MNEILRPAPIPAPMTNEPVPADLRAYCAQHSKMRESDSIAKIAPALVKTQAALVSPPRNRSVQVRTQAGSYAFRYATLDKITDMLRPKLAEAGLCVLQPVIAGDKGPVLLTRLLHESGEWMECEVPLPALGQNPQSFGSAITYMRRYSICSLLNISADEDDDGNRAAGNHMTDVSPERNAAKMRKHAVSARTGGADDALPEISDSARNAAFRTLIGRARVAESVEDGHELLDMWLKDLAGFEKLRGGPAWEVLERELGAGLRRSLGTDPAAAVVAGMRATDARQIDVLQTHWDGKWAGTLAAMEHEAPETFALLRRHRDAQAARVQGGAPAKPAAPAFAFPLLNEKGEKIGEHTDPVQWAMAYRTFLRGEFPGVWAAIKEKNHDALVAANKVSDAANILTDADAPLVQGGTGAPQNEAAQYQPPSDGSTVDADMLHIAVEVKCRNTEATLDAYGKEILAASKDKTMGQKEWIRARFNDQRAALKKRAG